MEEEIMKKCPKCGEYRLEKGFISLKGKPTKNCDDCLKKSREREAKRKPRKRDWKKYESQEHVKIRRKQWLKDHPEKAKEYYTNHRKRKREEDEESYLKHNAEVAAQWRINNPEKHLNNLNNAKKSVVIRLSIYKRSAKEKNYEWNLTDEEAEELFKSNCWYCGNEDERGLCGIDRFDSSIGYTLENCKSCCKICNYMKERIPFSGFVMYCGNIAGHHELIDEYPMVDSSILPITYNGSSIYDYKKRANKKKLNFDLTQVDFIKIQLMDCYLCGRESKGNKTNGIDRIDNTIGYTLENSKPCCKICNIMKKNHTLDKFLNQCKDIYIHCKDKVDMNNINFKRQ